MVAIRLESEDGIDASVLAELARRWQLTVDPQSVFGLYCSSKRLELRKLDEPRWRAITVDFIAGAATHRRLFGGGKQEAIAKAVGIKGNVRPSVVDATAGLGRDAFVLASLGCQVRMLERHPVIAALLDDGLQRGYRDAEIGHWLQQRLTLLPGTALSLLPGLDPAPEVIYLDPMFPHRPNSALVKKEMRALQSLVGEDLDADGLLATALRVATRRVVVKRPDYAPPLAGQIAQAVIRTKSHRFDLYSC